MLPHELAIGDGVNFKGIYDIYDKNIYLFTPNKENFEINNQHKISLSEIKKFVPRKYRPTVEDLELLEEFFLNLMKRIFIRKTNTRIFWIGLYSFGVRNLVNFISDHAPTPYSRAALKPPFDETSEQIQIEVNDTGFLASYSKFDKYG